MVYGPLRVARFSRVLLILSLALALGSSGSFAIDASGPNGSSSGLAFCVKTMLEEILSRQDNRPKPNRSAAEAYRDELKKMQSFCQAKILLFCKSTEISAQEQEIVLKALAQTRDFNMQLAFLSLKAEPKNPNYIRFRDYASRIIKHCDPPTIEACAPERWKTVVEDFLFRSGEFPERNYRRFGRWDDDNVIQRVPLLKEYIDKYSASVHPLQNNEKYFSEQMVDALSADAICVISVQTCKKMLNDISKAFSDAFGNRRREIFYQEIETVFSEAGVTIPKQVYSEFKPRGVYMDFKMDRFLVFMSELAESDPKKYDALINEAARRATDQSVYEIETRFPEITYIAQKPPSEWVKTASFFHPGYPPELNEVMASYRARLSRDGMNLSEDQLVTSFLSRARIYVDNARDLIRADNKFSMNLVKSGLLEPNGNISHRTALIMRKLSGQNVSEKAQSLLQTITTKFDDPIRMTEQYAAKIVQMWEAQEKMSIPLSSGDKMVAFGSDIPVLGSDGIGGGAYDAWAKGQAILDHWRLIGGAKNDAESVELLYAALKEGDANATQIIRSAPNIMSDAVNQLPEVLKNRVGIRRVFTSGDDAQVPLERLAQLPEDERDRFFSQVVRNLSLQSRFVPINRLGAKTEFRTGPSVVRAFAGSNKSNAEAAEQVSKAIEDRLSDRDFLGGGWRARYPHLSMLTWKGSDGSILVYIDAPNMDAQVRAKLVAAVKDKLRFPGDNTEVRFVD